MLKTSKPGTNLLTPPQPTGGGPRVPSQPAEWNVVVDLIQHMFATGEIPQMVPWSFLAVIPKPDGGTRGLSRKPDKVWDFEMSVLQCPLLHPSSTARQY